MKWEKRMLNQGPEVVFVYANGAVVSVNSKFLDSEVWHSAGFLKQIIRYENHAGMVATGNVVYMVCGEPIKGVSGDGLGTVVVLQPVTPEFLATIADALAESLRMAVHGTELAAGKHATISIGVAQLLPCETLASLPGGADAALYKAKASGRDCVVEG